MLYNEAIKLIDKHVPALTPKEPWVFMTFDSSSMNVGAYIGKFNGIHHLVFRPWGLRFEPETAELQAELTTAHEIVHQTQAEFVGQNRFWGFDFETEVPKNSALQVPDYNDINAVEDWSNRAETFVGDQQTQGLSLGSYLVEGMAEAAEYKILTGMILSGDRRDQAIKILRKKREYAQKYQADPKGWYPFEKYQRGVGMFRKLCATLSTDELTDFMKSVDMEACLKIQRLTPECESIIENPLSIPRIS